jgi:hypothetical protein
MRRHVAGMRQRSERVLRGLNEFARACPSTDGVDRNGSTIAA